MRFLMCNKYFISHVTYVWILSRFPSYIDDFVDIRKNKLSINLLHRFLCFMRAEIDFDNAAERVDRVYIFVLERKSLVKSSFNTISFEQKKKLWEITQIIYTAFKLE